jgi:succinyl-CoA synthetase beta subunit
MRCDFIAEGVIKATKELQLDIPLVVRLKGTKEIEAKQYALLLVVEPVLTCLNRMIKDSGLKIVHFDSLDEAAEKAVQLAN